MTGDPLYGPKLKIRWAHQHISQIHVALASFVQSKPCIFFKRHEPVTNEEVTYIKSARRTPEEVVMWTSYVVHNLRAALDQVVYALAVQNDASASQLRKAYFPIAGSREDFDGAGSQSKIAMLSDDAQRFVRMYEPYKGGNHNLWLLNALDVADKHKTLIDLGTSGTLSSFKESSTHPIDLAAPGWRPLDEDGLEQEIWRHPAGTNQSPQAEFTIVVSLRNVYEGQPHEPVAATLDRLAHAVEGFVTLAEVEFFR